jgi:hypothetical protein
VLLIATLRNQPSYGAPRILPPIFTAELVGIRRYYEAQIWVFRAPYLKVWRSWTNLQLQASITPISVNAILTFAFLK